MTVHYLRVPYDGADARRDCKKTDDGENVENLAIVTCEDCLRHERDRQDNVWRKVVCTALVEKLYDADAEDEGYDVWHYRANEVCLASKATLHVPMQEPIAVDWYCKLTPIPERFNNHGWNVKVCYRLPDSMSGYEHADLWQPINTSAFVLQSLVGQVRRNLEQAIQAGYKLGTTTKATA